MEYNKLQAGLNSLQRNNRYIDYIEMQQIFGDEYGPAAKAEEYARLSTATELRARDAELMNAPPAPAGTIQPIQPIPNAEGQVETPTQTSVSSETEPQEPQEPQAPPVEAQPTDQSFDQAVAQETVTPEAKQALGTNTLPTESMGRVPQTEAQITRYKLEKLYGPDLAEALINPKSQGLQDAMSPFEAGIYAVTGPAMIGGKTAAKIAVAGLPFEVPLTLLADATYDSNAAVGIILDVAAGMGPAMAIEKLAEKGTARAVKIAERFKLELEAQLNPKVEALVQTEYADKIFKSPAFSLQQRNDIQVSNVEFGNLPKPKPNGDFRVLSKPTNEPLTVTPKVVDTASLPKVSPNQEPVIPVQAYEATKLAARKTSRVLGYMRDKLYEGDLTDSTVLKVYEDTVTKLRAAGDLTEEDSAVLNAIEVKIAEAKSASAAEETAAKVPAFETLDKAEVDQDQFNIIKKQVTEEYYGQQKMPRAKALVGIKASLKARGAKGNLDELAEKRYAELKLSGELGEDFLEDLTQTYKLIEEQYKKSGAEFDPHELKDKITAQLKFLYEDDIHQEALRRVKQVNEAAMVGQRTSYIKGGTGDEDARFLVPPGKIVDRQDPLLYGSNYDYQDWDITDHMVLVPEINRIVYSSTPKPRQVTSNNKPRLFNFEGITNMSQATAALQKFMADWSSAKRLKWPKKGEGKFPENTAAKPFKVKSWYYDPVAKKTKDIVRLPDSEIEAIARMFGWRDSMVQVGNAPKDPKAKAYQLDPEDIIKNSAKFNEWETTNPGYLRKQADLPAEERHARYSQLNSAKMEYSAQMEEFLRKKLGFPPKALHATKFEYYNRLDELAVQRNLLMREIEHLKGTAYESQAYKMYLLFKDYTTGSTNFKDFNEMTRIRARNMGYEEAKAFNKYGIKPEDVDNAIANIAVEEGVSETVAARIYKGRLESHGGRQPQEAEEAIAELMERQDIEYDEAREAYEAMQREAEAFDEARQMADEAWMEDAGETTGQALGRASDEAGVDLSASTVTTAGVKQQLDLQNILQSDAMNIGKQVNQLENRFGMRVRSKSYVPKAIDGPGKFNLFKVNTLNDAEALIQKTSKYMSRFGAANEADAIKMATEGLGLTPAPGIPADHIRNLTVLISDSQAQIAEIGEQLVKHPDDLLTAVAFDKLLALNKLYISKLVSGKPSKKHVKAFERYNMLAESDYSLVEQLVKMVDDNYAFFGKNEADIRGSVALAEMITDLPSAQARATFMARMAEADELLHITDAQMNALLKRKELTKKLEAACGR